MKLSKELSEEEGVDMRKLAKHTKSFNLQLKRCLLPPTALKYSQLDQALKNEAKEEEPNEGPNDNKRALSAVQTLVKRRLEKKKVVFKEVH